MKKIFIICMAIIAILIAGLIALASIDFNRLGKEHHYVQIAGKGDLEEFTDSSGAVYKRYWYTLPAYDEKGDDIEVEFSAAKPLREGAFLMLYLKKGNEVTSYDEVQEKDLPSEVKAKFE